ncbi:Amino-acid acetyltransferase, mitochondrial [Halocaridina rubra]|uniref:Arginase n=1 Tax=Halocaridina rubra TaxID=373956 RepID=A0AAN8WZ26_HALRR
MLFKSSRRILNLLSSSSSSQARQVPNLILGRLKHSHIGIVSAAFNKGQRRNGVKDGPTVIKEAGLIKRLQEFDLKVIDYGTVSMEKLERNSSLQLGPDGERHHDAVLAYNRELASLVRKVIQENGLCLTLGGDHSIAIGTINGHAQANPDHQVVVLWVDAHADINTGGSSASGNMHGMPVSHHLRELAKDVNRLPESWPTPCMSGNHIAYIGLRDVEDCEQKFLDDLGILAFSMKEVEKLGIFEVINQCFKHLQPSTDRPLHLSFDIDALDPLEAPSTGTPVRGGLSLREGVSIVEAVRETGFLKAMDLVEVNPELGSEKDVKLTLQATKTILLAALAGRRGAF